MKSRTIHFAAPELIIDSVTRHIPNFLTLCNLSCGCFGIVAVFKGELQLGSIMIWSGAVFDFLDGFAARMLNRYSKIGKDLDSLADLITFCFLPGAIIYYLINENTDLSWLPYTGFLLLIFGALRLAKFNNDTRQSENFHGLPVPASGIFVSVLPFMTTVEYNGISDNIYVLIGITIFLSAMMVSDFRLMSLKFKDFSFKSNQSRYLLIIVSLVLLVIFKIVALPLIIIWYLALSIFSNVKKNRLRNV